MFFLLTIFLPLAVTARNQTVDDYKDVFFRWAFVSTSGENGDTMTPLHKQWKWNLPSDTQYAFYYLPIKNAYLYLFSFDSNNELTVHFPTDATLFDNNYHIEEYYIPGTDRWITFTKNTKNIRFYIIISGKRLKEMESVIAKYRYAKKKKRSTGILLQQDALYRIIGAYTRQTGDITTFNEPVSYSGVIRDVPQNNEQSIINLAQEVRTEHMYIKTIMITHNALYY